ncbi:hypothetical protein KQX54_017393 [Cotesia glomerata]|uniref:BEN domain-containing protein n=1 Tax=Cotesia glomerata TaxID=32391 RepID=A0AAV7I8Y1_COTGL|nr:hypothetical protein KQX54_017393 [Cotesia glomerata]
MPQSGVYVSYGDLKYCQQVSKDCKSLAKRLLSAVINSKALSVCLSITERTQASDNVGSNARPELDDHACTVLLNFVLEHGLQRGWNTDIQTILSTLHRITVRSLIGVTFYSVAIIRIETHRHVALGTENMSSTSGAQPPHSETANHLRGNYNYQEMGSEQVQAPQGTQYLPSQSGFLPTKFENVNYLNISYNYNGQGDVNYPNSNYNYNGQGFGKLPTPQGTQLNPFQFVVQPSELKNANNFQSNYNYQGLGFGQPLTHQEAEYLRSQSGLRSSLPTTTNVPSNQGKSFERNYQFSQNDLRGFYPSQYSPVQQSNNRQSLASSSPHIDAQAGSQATGMTSMTSVVKPADWLRLATIPAGYDLVCDPPQGFCWYQPRQQDMKYNVRP